jgi:hypothetical protein
MSTSRNTHPLNVSYLVVGLVFLGIAGSWALRQAGFIDLSEVRWLFPATLVAAGLVGVVALAAKGLSRKDTGYNDNDYDYEGEAR